MTKSSPKMPSTKEWKNSFLAKQGDSYFVSLPNDARADTIIIILNHMSSCDVFIRKLEYRVAEFGDEWVCKQFWFEGFEHFEIKKK